MTIIDGGFMDVEKGKFGDFSTSLRFYGPTIDVLVENYQTKALIDTGGACSMIDEEFAKNINLKPSGKKKCIGVTGEGEQNIFEAHIEIKTLKIRQNIELLSTNMVVKGGSIYQQIILGRDFLSNVIMIYDGFRGQVIISSLGSSSSYP